MQLSIHQLKKTYTTRKGNVSALAGVSFEVSRHEFISLVGPSGCGKTTLLKIVADLVPPDGGRVTFAGAAESKPHSAMVFQEDSLFPWLNVADNIAFGLEMAGMRRSERHRRWGSVCG